MTRKNEYFDLLKDWCDAMLRLQITEMKDPAFYGGILCPSCVRVHGRCADAIYPMMYMADVTGDTVYLDAAKRLFDWAEHNMSRPDGSYLNDTNSSWRGITVFSTIQLGEALLYHGHILDAPTRKRWEERLDRAARFLCEFIDHVLTNINYPITCSASMAAAGRALKNEAYMDKARELAHRALNSFTDDGLIFGEGKPHDIITPKGCRPVDLGYNVEETLPGLVTYAHLADDEEVLLRAMDSMRAHLEFMLPDGAWDNSWGTRSAKWTYWGSRTTDGSQIGYALLCDRDPLFGLAAHRSFELLRACTHDGLLHGGPMYHAAGEPACSHHTFCHAKMLACILDHHFEKPAEGKLPREEADGVRLFPSVRTFLLARGPWRATLTDYDFDQVSSGHATGGALTMLWHEQAGPVCAASMTEYQLTEANNMQLPQYYENICQTPRIELQKGGVWYRSINDKTASLACEDANGVITANARGILRDAAQNGGTPYTVDYTLDAEKLRITVSCEAEGAVYRLPVISLHTEPVALKDGRAQIESDGHTIELTCDTGLMIDETIPGRTFNPVGGFETIQFYTQLKAGAHSTFTLTIR